MKKHLVLFVSAAISILLGIVLCTDSPDNGSVNLTENTYIPLQESKIDDSSLALSAYSDETAPLLNDDSEAKAFSFESEITPTPSPSSVQPINEYTVFITDTGTKYHKAGCRYLLHSQSEISIKCAIDRGYSACSVCKP